MIDVNLSGVWFTCQAAVPLLTDGGSIVITSSGAGLRGTANLAHYVAAKHGLVGIVRTLAIELARRSIRVNSVHPTAVATEMILNDATLRSFRPDLDDPSPSDVEPAFRSLNLLPIPWVQLEDVAHAVLFLLSDESRYITSVALPVDAGNTQR